MEGIANNALPLQQLEIDRTVDVVFEYLTESRQPILFDSV